GAVIGMDAPLEFFKSRRPPCGIETVNAERFLGPVGMSAGRRDTCPTARVTEPLRLRQISLAPPQDFFGMLALGDIRDRPDKLHRPGPTFLPGKAHNLNVFD